VAPSTPAGARAQPPAQPGAAAGGSPGEAPAAAPSEVPKLAPASSPTSMAAMGAGAAPSTHHVDAGYWPEPAPADLESPPARQGTIDPFTERLRQAKAAGQAAAAASASAACASAPAEGASPLAEAAQSRLSVAAGGCSSSSPDAAGQSAP